MSLWVAFRAAPRTGTLWLWGCSTVTAERCHLRKSPLCQGGTACSDTHPSGTLQGHGVASRCSGAALPHSGASHRLHGDIGKGSQGDRDTGCPPHPRVTRCTPSCCHTRGWGLCPCHPAGTCGTWSSERWGQPAPADVRLDTRMCIWAPRCAAGGPDKCPGRGAVPQGSWARGVGAFPCQGLRPRSAGGDVLGSSLGAGNEFLGEA